MTSKPQPAADQVGDERVGGAGGVGTDQDRPGSGRLRQRQQRHRQHVDVVLGGVGAGVARPQDPAQCLPGPVAAVQPAAQRVQPEAVLERARRALLVGMRLHQAGVKIQPQWPRPLGCRARRPGPLADPRQRRPHPRHPPGIGGDLVDDPPRRRRRAHLAEQPRLVPQPRQVAEAVAAVGEHDHQVPQHRATVVCQAAAGAGKAEVGAAAKLAGERQPVGQFGQQHHPGVAADAVGVGGDLKAGTRVARLHRWGDPPAGGWDLQAAASSLVGRVPCYLAPTSSAPTRNIEARRCAAGRSCCTGPECLPGGWRANAGMWTCSRYLEDFGRR